MTATSLNGERHLGINQSNLGKALERLSSGLRINRAADDAAGMAVSETIRTQVRGLAQGSANSEDGINLLNTADGGLQEMHNILHRMRELVVQGANETYTDGDREKIQGEISQLTRNLDEISNNTEFNGIKLLRSGIGMQDGSIGVYLGASPGSSTIAATPGTPAVFSVTIPAVPAVFSATVPAVPAVFGPGIPTIMSSGAALYTVIGTQFSPAGVTIDFSSLGGLAVDSTTGNIYVAGSDPPTGALPVARPHAIIRINPLTGIDTKWAVTAGNASASGIAFNPTNNTMVFSGNTTGAGFIEQISTASAAGGQTGATIIHSLTGGPPATRVFFASGVQVSGGGVITYGTASPAYDPAVTGSGFLPGTNTNNIYTVGGVTTRSPLLVQQGSPFGATSPLLANVASNGGLHNNTGLPNNTHETTPQPNSSADAFGFGPFTGIPNPNGDNVFVQDYALGTGGRIFFSSRISAPFELDASGTVYPGQQMPAAGKFFVSTPAAPSGVTIKQIDLSTAPVAGVNPPVRFGGVAIEPISGDVFLSDRDNSRILRISNAGLPTQTITAISVGVPVIGMSFNAAGDMYMSTLTNNNEVWKVPADIPMVAPTVVTATVAAIPSMLITATVAAVPSTLISATIAATPTIAAVPATTGQFVYLDGSIHIQTGANEAQDIRVKINDMGLSSLSLEGMDVSRWGTNPYGSPSTDQYVEDVSYDLRRIDAAMATISTVRATFGAYTNRMEHAKSNVDNAGIQQAASESRIRDTDVAKATSELVRSQILSQASTDMLGQIQRVNGQLVMGLIQGVGR
ncbi:MAG: hypothetical protein H7338_12535 [Candidatus Sericytochromatia bacterium]|nr:hypothetical protein [Candidatus Sericytochromatia bacterium]